MILCAEQQILELIFILDVLFVIYKTAYRICLQGFTGGVAGPGGGLHARQRFRGNKAQLIELLLQGQIRQQLLRAQFLFGGLGRRLSLRFGLRLGLGFRLGLGRLLDCGLGGNLRLGVAEV